jgi:hypothetical protein
MDAIICPPALLSQIEYVGRKSGGPRRIIVVIKTATLPGKRLA